MTGRFGDEFFCTAPVVNNESHNDKQQQEAQLSQRDRAAVCLNFDKKYKCE